MYDDWLKRVARARKKKRPGDILTLAAEAPTERLRAEAYRQAGATLRRLGNDSYARTCYADALALDSRHGRMPQRERLFLKQSKKSARRSKRPRPPRLIFLFAGHMIDSTHRKETRFPPHKEHVAARAIAAKLDQLGACAKDLALCGGACGGDLLFAEACIARGAAVELRIPFRESTFLRRSVSFAPGNWTERFYRVKADPNTELFVMPDELGPVPKGQDPHARDNLWQLYSALSWGPEKVRFICLWNRKGGNRAGGTGHMYEMVQHHSGRVYVLDTTKLW